MHAYHLTQWVLFFFIYSFIGWIWESCYVSVRKHRWVNRGFLHGPLLPIYGSGALVILISTIGIRENPYLVFLVGMAAATVLEYVTGAVMERVFHVRYWDYSRQKLNVNGYICASSSLCWGFFSVLLVRVVHVPVERAVLDIPMVITDAAALTLTLVTSVDLTQSFNEAMDLKHILAQLEESKEQIRKMQEKIKAVSEEVLEAHRLRSDEIVAEYRERSEKLAETCRLRAAEIAGKSRSRKEMYLEKINEKREQRRLQLEELADRAEALMKEKLPSKLDELIGDGGRKGLAEFRANIAEELHRISSRSDRSYLHSASQLRRNPTAVSRKFADALEELKDSLDDINGFHKRETERKEQDK